MKQDRETRYFIGLMSGTSMDGVDAVLTAFSDEGHVKASHKESTPYPEVLKARLERLCENCGTPDELAQSDMEVGQYFADTANRLLANRNLQPQHIRAIGSHGQTIRHGADQHPPFSLQIGSPALIAEQTGLDTIADFRSRDIAAGGQGAPLAPAFHQRQFSVKGERRAIVNIGGMANVTWLPEDNRTPPKGFDTGPGNRLVDLWSQIHLGEPFDDDGSWAASGELLPELQKTMLEDPYFLRQGPRSTGREYFNRRWLEARLKASSSENARPEDIQHTLLAVTASTIALGILENGTPDSVYVCGGGAFNSTLMALLGKHLAPARVATTTELGIDPQCVEGAAFAWLAYQHCNGQACDLTCITGARGPRILGARYPA